MSKEEIIEAIDEVIKFVKSGKQDTIKGIQEIQSILSLNQSKPYRTWYLEKHGKLPQLKRR